MKGTWLVVGSWPFGLVFSVGKHDTVLGACAGADKLFLHVRCVDTRKAETESLPEQV